MHFSFVWFVYVVMCFPRPYTIYIFHTPMAQYSLHMLKVPLNTKQANKQTFYQSLSCFCSTCPNHLNLLFLIITLTGSSRKSSPSSQRIRVFLLMCYINLIYLLTYLLTPLITRLMLCMAQSLPSCGVCLSVCLSVTRRYCV